MKKSHIAFLMAAGISLSPLALAKQSPTTLAVVIPGGCSVDATMLDADWTWENGTAQTKFGGDALFLADVSYDGELVQEEFEVEFELDKYDAEEETMGAVVYDCDATGETGSCSGSMMGVDDAIAAAIVDEFGEGYTFEAIFDGVYVKAMNPGNGNGRQNFELVDVCEVTITSP
jgi:hypothetical protein